MRIRGEWRGSAWNRDGGARALGAVATSAAFLIGATPARADDAASPADNITVTATRIPQSVLDVPATVSVIGADTIADNLVSNIKDLVRYEPGVSVQRSPVRFGAAQGSTGRAGNAGFNIRGLDADRVLIQVDGIRLPDSFDFGAQSVGRGDYVDVGLVKSVEILRGPASALYGSDGLAGAVSFTTSDPADFLGTSKSIGGQVRAGYDSSDRQFAETGILAGRAGDWSAMVAYTRRDGHELKNQGDSDAPNATRTAPNPQDTQSNAVLAKLVWAPDANNRVRLALDHLDDRITTDVLSGIAAVPSSATSVLGLTALDRTKRDRASIDWRYDGGIGWLTRAQVAAYYQNSRDREFTAEDRNTAADRTRLNTFDNRVIGGSAELRSDFTTGPITHKLVWGGDVTITRQQGIRSGTVPTAPDAFPTRAFPITDYTLAGGYIADEIGIAGSVLTLFPALRFDQYKLSPKRDVLLPASFVVKGQSGSKVSPKIGAVLKLTRAFNFFVNYAQGFKAPESSQVNQYFENLTSPFFAYRTIPNPDLKPETSRTFEGGIRLHSDAVDMSITGYTGRYRNFIDQEITGGQGTVADPIIFQFINLSRARIKGIEGKLEGRSGFGMTGNLAISYTKGDLFDDTVGKSALLSVDPLKLVVGVGYRDKADRFGGDLTMTHSEGKPLSRTTGGCTATCFVPSGFTILDATVFVRVAKAFTVRAGVFNLTDAKYIWWSDVRGLDASASAISDAYTQPGRNASVSLTARF
jgi:hemoglobin/transferrin/lactoferrin receptor protein